MGNPFKNLSQFGTFCLCNLSWLKIVFLVVLHLKIKRRISGNSERPNSYHTSMSPRNFPDTDILHGFKCAPKILYRREILAHSVQREEGTQENFVGSRSPKRRVVLQKMLFALTVQLFFCHDTDSYLLMPSCGLHSVCVTSMEHAH